MGVRGVVFPASTSTASARLPLGHLKCASSERTLQASPEPPKDCASSGRKQQQQANNVREDTRSNQESTPDQDRCARQEGLSGKSANRQVMLDGAESPGSLPAGECGAEDSGRRHEGEGRPESHDLSHPDEKAQLHQWDENEEAA